MKKIYTWKPNLLCLFVITVTLIFVTCSSSGKRISYDDTTPQNKKCTLLIQSEIKITSFNGKAVDWTATPEEKYISVQIPEGKHVFILNCKYQGKKDFYAYENTRYEPIEFKAGRTYRMFPEEVVINNSWALLFKTRLVK